MPTILRENGYEIQIFTQDHVPPHVHVFARGCEAIFNLHCPDGAVGTRDNFGFKSPELKKIKQIVQQHQATLCEAWEEIHADLG